MTRKLVFDANNGYATPLRREFSSLWGRLRCALLKEHGAVCSACRHAPENVGDLHGHEIWSFPAPDVIRLEHVQLLCRTCHRTVHLGRSLWRAREHAMQEYHRTKGRKTQRAAKAAGDAAEDACRAALVEHYCTVNGVTAEQCEEDFCRARPPEGWKTKPWSEKATTDYGLYQDEVRRNQERRPQRQQTAGGQLRVIARYLRKFWAENGEGDLAFDSEDILEIAREHEDFRSELADYTIAEDFENARRVVDETLQEMFGPDEPELYSWPYMHRDEDPDVLR